MLTGSSVSYNFSDALSKAYDDNPTDAVPSMISLSTNPSIYGIISGDVNQDGNINLADLLLVEASITNQVIFCQVEL